MRWKPSLLFSAFLIALTVSPYASGIPVRHNKGDQPQKLVKKGIIHDAVRTKDEQKKSLLLPSQSLPKNAFEDAKKKGTIRLSGPWHSDSSLDRNIDPQEDSYVKKVIASNEGLNFNKDMAEAGEVFDVNGIEDFYDKSALITYEVNGHEIPVHMKPKLTPQNQPMFPEYGHESPSGPNIPESRSNGAHSQDNPGRKATTFYGMSLKDMPEYKVLDTPSVGDKPRQNHAFAGRAQMHEPRPDDDNSFTSRHRLASNARPSFPDPGVSMRQPPQETARFANSQPPVDKFSSEYAQANAFGQEDVRMGNRIQGFDQSQNRNSDFEQTHRESSEAGYNRKQDDSQYSDAHQYFAKNRNDNSDSVADNVGRYQQQPHSLEPAEPVQVHGAHELFDRPSNGPADIAEFHHSVKQAYSGPLGDDADQFKMRPALKEFYNKPTMSSEAGRQPSEDSMMGGQSRGVGKDYNGEKLAPAEAQPKEHQDEQQSSNEKADDSNQFFEQLEKIDEQKQKSEKQDAASKDKSQYVSSNSQESSSKGKGDEKEKSKAKDKLLKILGDLTSKLKGMEAAVKDTHTDERRESSSTYSDSRESQQKPTGQKSDDDDDKQRRHDSRDSEEEHSSRESEAAMDHASESEDRAYANRRLAEEAAKLRNARLQEAIAERLQSSERPEPSYAANAGHPIKVDRPDDRPDQISHMISKFKQHQRPFIFNTESIDYKGPHDSRESGQNDEGNEGKARVHHLPQDHSRLLNRPIISEFYHDARSASDGYPDLDDSRSHSENSPSDNREVTPTQRDGGHRSSESSKDDESFDADSVKPKETSDAKSGKNREAENKPEIDEDLPDYNEVKDAAIFEENLIRKKYHSDGLRWSDDLSDEAQKQADDMAGEKNLDLNKSKIPKGENIALLPLNSLNVGKESADMWQKESGQFDFVSPLITKKNADFAQMVWKSAKEFGLGVAKTRDRSNWIVVAKYDTPVVAEYEKLKANLESDIPVPDPYSDIARRST